jgi:hypothetical protein
MGFSSTSHNLLVFLETGMGGGASVEIEKQERRLWEKPRELVLVTWTILNGSGETWWIDSAIFSR